MYTNTQVFVDLEKDCVKMRFKFICTHFCNIIFFHFQTSWSGLPSNVFDCYLDPSNIALSTLTLQEFLLVPGGLHLRRFPKVKSAFNCMTIFTCALPSCFIEDPAATWHIDYVTFGFSETCPTELLPTLLTEAIHHQRRFSI